MKPKIRYKTLEVKNLEFLEAIRKSAIENEKRNFEAYQQAKKNGILDRLREMKTIIEE